MWCLTDYSCTTVFDSSSHKSNFRRGWPSAEIEKRGEESIPLEMISTSIGDYICCRVGQRPCHTFSSSCCLDASTSTIKSETLRALSSFLSISCLHDNTARSFQNYISVMMYLGWYWMPLYLSRLRIVFLYFVVYGYKCLKCGLHNFMHNM